MRRPKPEQIRTIEELMRAQVSARTDRWRIGETVVAEGPMMAEMVESVLGIESDSQQREVGKWLAKQNFVVTLDGRRVTCVSSGEAALKYSYPAEIGAKRSAAGSSPTRSGSRSRGRPRKEP